MAHQCPLEDRHEFEKITKLAEEDILFKLSYEFFSPRYIYFCEKNSFIAILCTLKLKIKITDVSVSGHVFSHIDNKDLIAVLELSSICFMNLKNLFSKINFKCLCSLRGSIKYLCVSLGMFHMIFSDKLYVLSREIASSLNKSHNEDPEKDML